MSPMYWGDLIALVCYLQVTTVQLAPLILPNGVALLDSTVLMWEPPIVHAAGHVLEVL